jgi:hypothetical protein
MPMDFPASPTNGQVFTSGGVSYTWNGYAWVGGVAGGAGYVLKAGDTMTGALAISDTTVASSTTTGALTVAGGLGVAGLFYSQKVTAVRSGAAGALIQTFDTDATATAQNSVVFTRNSIGVGTITTTNVATAYNTSSDVRLKEDLQSFDAGRIIDETEVYDFRWKETDERSYGIAAQQAVEVYAEPIFHDEEQDWWGVDYSKYVPVLLQELKALRARFADMEAQLKDLKRG